MKKKQKRILLISIIIILSLIIFTIFSVVKINERKTKIKEDIIGSKETQPQGFTFLEGLGFSFLTSGLSYQFGVTPELVEKGFETLLSTNFKEDATENNASINPDIYEKITNKTLDSKGNIIDNNDLTTTFILPKDVNEKNIDSTTNLWALNYRFYKNGLTGLQPSYWYSQLFKEDIYFDRAWNSVVWMCQKYFNCIIIKNEQNNLEAIFYSNDVYWYLYLDKLYNINILNISKPINCISMKVEPIKEKDAISLMKSKNIVIK